jgi:hypothetical protein
VIARLIVILLAVALCVWLLTWILVHAGLVVIGVVGLGLWSWWRARRNG